MAGILRADTARLNTIKSQDSDVTAMTITAGGVITASQRPRVMVQGRNTSAAYNGAEYAITGWHATTYNTGFTISSGKIVIPADGFYQVSALASEFASSNHPNAIVWKEDSGGTGTYLFYQFEINDYDNKCIAYNAALDLSAGDKLIMGFHNSYAGPTTSSANKYKVHLSCYLI